MTENTGFLQTLFDGKAELDYLLVWTKLGEDKHSEWFTDPVQAEQYAIAQRDRDTWFGVGLSEADYGPSFRCKAEQVTAIAGLWADLDVEGPAHKAKGLFPDKGAALALLHELPCLPTVVVDSGHGLQAFWCFKELWTLATAADRGEARALEDSWLATIRTYTPWPVDGVGDLARVMRMPGTVNHKIPGEPVEVHILENGGPRYDPSELEEYLRAPAAPTRRDQTPDKPPPAPTGEALGGAYWLAQAQRKAPGGRHNAGKDLAVQLRAAGLSLADASVFMGRFADHCETLGPCDEPAREHMAKLLDWAYDLQNFGKTPAIPAPRCTDMGNGHRFALQHAQQVKYVGAWGWMVWDGRRWARDDAGAVMRLARLTVRGIYQEAADEPDEEERKHIARWAERSESLRVRLNMLESARSEEGIPAYPEDFDRDPWLFNCWNGALDLRTGEIKAHDPEDMMTRISPVTFTIGASSPVWNDFLTTATQGDAELSAYLRRVAGYSLTGGTTEEVFWLLLGPEATGKTTLSEALRTILGDYAVKASFDTFLEQRTGGARGDIAGLAGARLVTAVEANATKRMAEPLIKELVGGDTISARHLYHESFSFKPQCKVVLAANASPKISDEDGAIWRRLRRLPFEHVIPEDKRDPEVKAFLTDPERGGPAVLAWAVQGCLEWQKARLGYPSCIREKTRELRDSMDPLKDFIAERCVGGVDEWVVTGALRAAYEKWASDRGEKPTIQGREWGKRLRALGAEPKSKRTEDGSKIERGWQGIGLKSVTDSDDVTDVTP